MDLSFANVGETSHTIDWTEAHGEDAEGWQIVLPTITDEIVEEYAPEIVGTEAWDLRHSDRESLEFEVRNADRFYEFEDGLSPMMNFYWPVHLPGNANAAETAARVRAWGGCVTLVEIKGDDGEYFNALALTGGGMDLSWNLAAAYLACGNVPPHILLSGLPNYGDLRSCGVPVDVAERIVHVAIPAAALWLESRAKRLREVAETFTPPAWNSPEGQDARSRDLMRGSDR